MSLWLRSLAFNVALYGLTAVMCFLMIWVLPLPRQQILRVVHLWLKQVAWVEKHIGGLTYRIIGREYVPKGACIIASKHQSAWETFKLHILFYDPAIVLKKELLNIPIWGWYLRRAGMIPIDRAGRARALSAMMQAAHATVRAQRKIVIFPQGTRVAPGAEKSYKSGIAALYQELNVPIVPMALNSGVFWPKNSFLKKPGIITIEFLPPIPPGLERSTMMERLRSGLEAASDRLAQKTS
ncbi:MAG: lysophospholipid acyltransferase family protein [Alphaproteobacteria bacterium]|nr:lysophospholipid acyltransferase family protein [Alphaproteobacteria bacterium]